MQIIGYIVIIIIVLFILNLGIYYINYTTSIKANNVDAINSIDELSLNANKPIDNLGENRFCKKSGLCEENSMIDKYLNDRYVDSSLDKKVVVENNDQIIQYDCALEGTFGTNRSKTNCTRNPRMITETDGYSDQ